MTAAWSGTAACPHCGVFGRCKVLSRRETSRRVRCCGCGQPYSVRDDGSTAKRLYDGHAGIHPVVAICAVAYLRKTWPFDPNAAEVMRLQAPLNDQDSQKLEGAC